MRALAVATGGPRPLLLGRHLIELGVPPGPELGVILRAVFERQLDGEVTTLEEARAAARAELARRAAPG
jgi:tRNA nucleotidyltransferase (CCA-adding enzyme)